MAFQLREDVNMSHVVYNTKSTILLTDNHYATESAAKAGLTRYLKKHPELNREDYSISDGKTFYATIEKQVEKINLMSGKPYMERVNTPLCTSPASETYWSM